MLANATCDFFKSGLNTTFKAVAGVPPRDDHSERSRQHQTLGVEGCPSSGVGCVAASDPSHTGPSAFTCLPGTDTQTQSQPLTPLNPLFQEPSENVASALPDVTLPSCSPYPENRLPGTQSAAALETVQPKGLPMQLVNEMPCEPCGPGLDVSQRETNANLSSTCGNLGEGTRGEGVSAVTAALQKGRERRAVLQEQYRRELAEVRKQYARDCYKTFCLVRQKLAGEKLDCDHSHRIDDDPPPCASTLQNSRFAQGRGMQLEEQDFASSPSFSDLAVQRHRHSPRETKSRRPLRHLSESESRGSPQRQPRPSQPSGIQTVTEPSMSTPLACADVGLPEQSL